MKNKISWVMFTTVFSAWLSCFAPVKAKDNELGHPGQSSFNKNPAELHAEYIPASNVFTKVDLTWGTRSIATSAAVDATTQFIPTNSDTTAWQPKGKITLDTETMEIIEHINFVRNGTLKAPVKDDDQDVVIFSTNQWPKGSGWGYLDEKEIITWKDSLQIGATTELTQKLTKDTKDNILKVKSTKGFFRFQAGNKMYLYVDTEIMRIVDFGPGDGKTIKVERAQFKTDLAEHDVGEKVHQPWFLVGVQRGQGGTAKINHEPGVKIETKDGFLVAPRGASGKAHAAGTKINYMYSDSQHKKQIRSTFAHECGHSCYMKDYVGSDPCIMKKFLTAGSIDGNGINHKFSWHRLRFITVTNK